MNIYRIVYSDHASLRMTERSLTKREVALACLFGETIKAYPNDTPYPSELILHWSGSKPLHVVVATHTSNRVKFVVTAYIPDPRQWEDDFRRRKP